MSLFDRPLAYADFYRTGQQDCANVIDLADFDLDAGTPEQIVEATMAQWEEDGLERQWLEQQDDFEELDPSRCYREWRAGWKACAVRAISQELEDWSMRARENPASSDFDEAMGYASELAAIMNKHGIQARAWGKPGVGARVYVGRLGGFLSVSRGGDVSDRSRGAATMLPSHLFPRQQEAYKAARQEYRDLRSASYATENPGGQWWKRPFPEEQRLCYATKGDALRVFADVNRDIIEAYGGLSYQVGPSEFDAINHKYGLKGKRAVRTIGDALWVAMPVGKPYCLDRIDIDVLNETSPARPGGGTVEGFTFRLPDYAYEELHRREEALRYAEPVEAEPSQDAGDEDLPSWVTDDTPYEGEVEPGYDDEKEAPAPRLPPLPPMERLVPVRPYRLELEEREPGVETYRIYTSEEDEPLEPPPIYRSPPAVAAKPMTTPPSHRLPPAIADEPKPYRLELEEREPGVETYRILNPACGCEPHDNPSAGWVAKVIAKNYSDIEGEVPDKWLPKMTAVRSAGGRKVTATMKEYGCGNYGCVLPTHDPKVVLKLTTDQTEAEFATALADKLSARVVVRYHKAVSVPEKFHGAETYLLWRDAADRVGDILDVVKERGGDDRAAFMAIKKQHTLADKAYDALAAGKPAKELLSKWKAATREMGKVIPELAPLAKGMVTVLEKDGVLFGDVHDGNIGLINGRWEIIDPGNIAVLSDEA